MKTKEPGVLTITIAHNHAILTQQYLFIKIFQLTLERIKGK